MCPTRGRATTLSRYGTLAIDSVRGQAAHMNLEIATNLITRVNRVAHGLLARGYGRSDALALASGNSAEFLVTYFACAKLGIVCVPMNLGWRADEIAYVLDHSESIGIVAAAQLVGPVAPAVENVPAVREV